MIENWGAFLSAWCWIAAAIQYGYSGNWRMTIVSIMYSTATFVLMGAH